MALNLVILRSCRANVGLLTENLINTVSTCDKIGKI